MLENKCIVKNDSPVLRSNHMIWGVIVNWKYQIVIERGCVKALGIFFLIALVSEWVTEPFHLIHGFKRDDIRISHKSEGCCVEVIKSVFHPLLSNFIVSRVIFHAVDLLRDRIYSPTGYQDKDSTGND